MFRIKGYRKLDYSGQPMEYKLLSAIIKKELAALAQMVACLPLVQQVRGSIPGGVVNFNLKIFNLGTRRGGDVHFLIARLYICQKKKTGHFQRLFECKRADRLHSDISAQRLVHLSKNTVMHWLILVINCFNSLKSRLK